jgi:hypothetical protein
MHGGSNDADDAVSVIDQSYEVAQLRSFDHVGMHAIDALVHDMILASAAALNPVDVVLRGRY